MWYFVLARDMQWPSAPPWAKLKWLLHVPITGWKISERFFIWRLTASWEGTRRDKNASDRRHSTAWRRGSWERASWSDAHRPNGRFVWQRRQYENRRGLLYRASALFLLPRQMSFVVLVHGGVVGVRTSLDWWVTNSLLYVLIFTNDFGSYFLFTDGLWFILYLIKETSTIDVEF